MSLTLTVITINQLFSAFYVLQCLRCVNWFHVKTYILLSLASRNQATPSGMAMCAWVYSLSWVTVHAAVAYLYLPWPVRGLEKLWPRSRVGFSAPPTKNNLGCRYWTCTNNTCSFAGSCDVLQVVPQLPVTKIVVLVVPQIFLVSLSYTMRHHYSPWDLMIHHETRWDVKRHHETVTRQHIKENLCDMKYHVIMRYELPCDITRHHETQESYHDLHLRTSADIMSHHEISWVTMLRKHHETIHNTMRHHLEIWKSEKPQKTWVRN